MSCRNIWNCYHIGLISLYPVLAMAVVQVRELEQLLTAKAAGWVRRRLGWEVGVTWLCLGQWDFVIIIIIIIVTIIE